MEPAALLIIYFIVAYLFLSIQLDSASALGMALLFTVMTGMLMLLS